MYLCIDTPSPGESTPLATEKHPPTGDLTLPPIDHAQSRQIDSSPIDTGQSDDIPIKAHSDDNIEGNTAVKEETDQLLEERELGRDYELDSSSDDESVPLPAPSPAPPTDSPALLSPPPVVPSDHQLPTPVVLVEPVLPIHRTPADETYNSNNVLSSSSNEGVESEVMDTPPSPVGPHLVDTLVAGEEVGGAGGGASSDEKMMQRDDLDFSIDMSKLNQSINQLIIIIIVGIYNGLNSSERISLIQDKMKAIQNKYMELKSEVTYLDRKRRRARKREREGMNYIHTIRTSICIRKCNKNWG